MNKLNHEHLLVKRGQAVYETPCKTYRIEYTNIGYLDDINWVATSDNLVKIYGETLQDVLDKLVKKHSYMESKLYRILYNCLDK